MNDFTELPQQTPGHIPVLPALSPLFMSADDAARWAYERIDYSVADKEYGVPFLNKATATSPRRQSLTSS